MSGSAIRRNLRVLRDLFVTSAARCGAAREAMLGRIVERRLRRRAGEIRNSHVPVVINNRDRVTTLSQLVAWLEKAGFQDILILDNDSSYSPLLEYYRTSPHRVVHLGRNIGCKALWSSGIFRLLRNHFYIYTDPDVIPAETCPLEIVPHLVDILGRYPARGKVGLGLRIDDLPACFAQRDEVIQWETRFWQKPLEPGLYDAPIDTTFALYRPRASGIRPCPSLRTGLPYVARHAPWYVDSVSPPPEERYYRDHANPGFSWWAGRDRPRHAAWLLQWARGSAGPQGPGTTGRPRQHGRS